jgi:hypothetical protein
MPTLFVHPGAVLAAVGRRAGACPVGGWALLMAIALAAPIFGLAMGSHDLSGPRWRYAVFAGIKMPLMILGSGAVCLPGFVVLMRVLGLGDDLRQALRAILSSQVAVTFALASLAPVLLFFYASGVSHRGAILTSGVLFLVATLVGQAVLLRHYRPLIARSRKHLVMLAYWLAAYVFVGIQMGWMLRPFVGTPGKLPTFLRDEPFSNAYIVVFRLVFGTG